MRKILNLILIIIIFVVFTPQLSLACCNAHCEIKQNKIIIENTVYPSRNTNIPATITIPKNKNSFPLVIIAHGFGTSRIYDKGLIELSELLSENGIASIRMDFAGCGESKESFRQFTLKTSKLDIINAVNYMKSRYNITKIGVLGYSFGGRIIVEMLAEKQNFDSVILIAPCIDNRTFSMTDEGYSFEDLKKYAQKNGYVPFVTNRDKVLEISYDCIDGILFYDKPEVLLNKAKQSSKEIPILVVWPKDDKLVTPDMNLMTSVILEAKSFEASGDGHNFGFLSNSSDKMNTKLRKRVVKKMLKFFNGTLR